MKVPEAAGGYGQNFHFVSSPAGKQLGVTAPSVDPGDAMLAAASLHAWMRMLPFSLPRSHSLSLPFPLSLSIFRASRTLAHGSPTIAGD